MQKVSEDTWCHLGMLASQMQKWDRAMECHERVLEYNPIHSGALIEIAYIHEMKENWAEALVYLQRVVTVNTDNATIWRRLGRCFMMMGDMTKASNAYSSALEHDPRSEDPNLWYGVALISQDGLNYAGAKEALENLIRLDPGFNREEVLFRLGIVTKHLEEYDRALECFFEILTMPLKCKLPADIWFEVGLVYEQMKDFEKALEWYQKILERDAKHPIALQQIGWVHFQSGAQDKAVELLQESKEVDPSNGKTWYLLGRIYMASKDYQKAHTAYQQAVICDNKNPTFWCSIGVLYYQDRQYQHALDAYAQAVRLDPGLSEVWYNLGTLYESCRQLRDALATYEKSYALDPHNEAIRERLTRLKERLLTETPECQRLNTAEGPKHLRSPSKLMSPHPLAASSSGSPMPRQIPVYTLRRPSPVVTRPIQTRIVPTRPSYPLPPSTPPSAGLGRIQTSHTRKEPASAESSSELAQLAAALSSLRNGGGDHQPSPARSPGRSGAHDGEKSGLGMPGTPKSRLVGHQRLESSPHLSISVKCKPDAGPKRRRLASGGSFRASVADVSQ